MLDDKILITDEEGNEKEYTILLTFRLDDFDKDYVVFYEEGSDDLYASSYVQDDKEGGSLSDVISDEEWDQIEEVIEAFLVEEDFEENK